MTEKPEPESGEVLLDTGAAAALVAAITEAKERVEGLRAMAATDLAQPVPFGENWVGEAVSARVAGAGAGQEDSMSAVLGEFGAVLEELAAAVKDAADAVVETDEDVAHLYREL